MRARLAMAAALFCAAGCTEKTPAPSPATGAGSQAASAPSSSPASQAASAPASQAPGLPQPPAVVAPADWARLFDGDKAALPTPLADLRFEQTKGQLAERYGAKLAADGKLALDGMAGLPVRLGFHAGSESLRFVQLTVPEGVVAALMGRWGKPTKEKLSPARDGLWWLGDGVQAIFETRKPRHYLTFWPLTPWRALVGDTKGQPGFQRDVPILGADGTKVAKAFVDAQPRASKGELDLHLPPHERQPRPTKVRLSLDDTGVVTAATLVLSYGRQAAMRDAVLAHVAKIYGAGKKEGDVTRFPGLTVNDRDQVGRLLLTWTLQGK